MLQSLELTSKQNELNGTKHNGQKMKKQKSQFVLLSAFCCGKPVLQFQFAKIKLEEEIRKVSGSVEGVTHSIVRPTAYFKSLDGQIESAKRGTYVLTHVTQWWPDKIVELICCLGCVRTIFIIFTFFNALLGRVSEGYCVYESDEKNERERDNVCTCERLRE